MSASTFEFKASDGIAIFTRRWTPPSAPRAVLLIAHGMSEHSARYDRFASQAIKDGIAIYAPDHRGHGVTARGDENLGFMGPDGWNRVVADLRELLAHVQSQHPGLPLLVLGHSMGSFMVQQCLFDLSGQVKAVIMSGTSGKPPAIATVGILAARFEAWRLGPKGRSTLINAMSFGDFNKQFGTPRTAFDWLSRDPAEVDKYVADPHCGFICSASYWADFLPGLQFINRPEEQKRVRPDLPVLMVSGALDPVSQQGRGVQQLADAYRAAGLKNVTVKLYPDARHELFNETNREDVTADVMAFIQTHLANSKET